jgi:hypothetical protein
MLFFASDDLLLVYLVLVRCLTYTPRSSIFHITGEFFYPHILTRPPGAAPFRAYNESLKKSRSNYSENEGYGALHEIIEVLALKIISGMILNG